MGKQNTTVSFPIGGLLGVTFVVLKLTGVIDWSWWWVTLPFWGPMALVLTFMAMGIGFVLLWDKLSR